MIESSRWPVHAVLGRVHGLPLSSRGREFCANRCIDPEVAFMFGVRTVKALTVDPEPFSATELSRVTAFQRFLRSNGESLVFPWVDLSGNTLGWKARALSSKAFTIVVSDYGKWYNPLFGLVPDVAMNRFRSLRAAVLVEGELDQLAFSGVGCSVPAMAVGTSGATARQVEWLARFCRTVFLMFDNDAAGRAAASKQFYRFQRVGVRPVLVEYAAKDPNDLVQAGEQYYRSVVEFIDSTAKMCS